MLANSLFIVRDRGTVVEEFDTIKCTSVRHLPVKRLKRPRDMTSSSKFQYLVISEVDGAMLHRVGLDGSTIQWSVEGSPCGLSVTSDSEPHLLATLNDVCKLLEYNMGGVLVQTISLQELVSPWHTILSGGRYIVAHGFWSNPIRRVCAIDSMGHVVQSYDGSASGSVSVTEQLAFPAYLVVDREGNVIVTYRENKIVLLLSSTLSDGRELVLGHDIERPDLIPVRICLDEKEEYHFISDSSSTFCDVLVVQIRSA